MKRNTLFVLLFCVLCFGAVFAGAGPEVVILPTASDGRVFLPVDPSMSVEIIDTSTTASENDILVYLYQGESRTRIDLSGGTMTPYGLSYRIEKFGSRLKVGDNVLEVKSIGAKTLSQQQVVYTVVSQIPMPGPTPVIVPPPTLKLEVNGSSQDQNGIPLGNVRVSWVAVGAKIDQAKTTFPGLQSNLWPREDELSGYRNISLNEPGIMYTYSLTVVNPVGEGVTKTVTLKTAGNPIIREVPIVNPRAMINGLPVQKYFFDATHDMPVMTAYHSDGWSWRTVSGTVKVRPKDTMHFTLFGRVSQTTAKSFMVSLNAIPVSGGTDSGWDFKAQFSAVNAEAVEDQITAIRRDGTSGFVVQGIWADQYRFEGNQIVYIRSIPMSQEQLFEGGQILGDTDPGIVTLVNVSIQFVSLPKL